MTELVATALTMVDSSTEDVRSAIVDYQDRRQLLLPQECVAYEVVAEDDGVGAEVAMTLALDQVIRNRRGARRKKKRPKGKQEPLQCVFRLEELTDERIVERDTRSSLCTTWTLRPTEDDRTAVHVHVSWDAPDGVGNFLRRQNEKLAMRMLYEDILTKLHELFQVDEPAPEDDTEAEDTSSAEPSPAEPSPAEPGESETGAHETDAPASPAPANEPPAERGGSSPGQS